VVSATVHGRVDGEGRLISADPRLLALHRRAGGSEGGPVAIPQIASVARLARSLGILVSRSIIAADGDLDLDLWVRAQPEGEGIDLAIGGWEERPALKPVPVAVQRQPDTSEELLWESDARLKLSAISVRLASLSGLSTDTIIGQALTGLFKLDESGDGELPILSAVAARRRFAGQRASLRNDGKTELILSGVPVISQSGAFGGFRGSARLANPPDVVLAPPETIEAAPPVTDTGFAKRLDTALREPLARIIAGADSIGEASEGPLRQDYQDYAHDISTAGRHLMGMVDDLSDLQAVERASFVVETEALDLADIARRAAGLLGVRAADSGVRIDKPAEDEKLPACGDFRRVLQILVNLIGNAVRYSPQGSMVWIRTEAEGDLAAVVVADQGKGIAATDHDRIFEKFERVDASEPGGSGLGLYISRRLARAMGGDITVDSAPGQGARFVLTLPTSPD
jgi:Histidine kinase-, DNA gyrase B-, and HSP90-like ATPase